MEFIREDCIYARQSVDRKDSTKISFDSLYDSRNNIHILKAAQNNYTPTLIEAKNAFALMRTFVSEVKTFYFSKNNN